MKSQRKAGLRRQVGTIICTVQCGSHHPHIAIQFQLAKVQFHGRTGKYTDPSHHHIKFYRTVLIQVMKPGEQANNQRIRGCGREKKTGDKEGSQWAPVIHGGENKALNYRKNRSKRLQLYAGNTGRWRLWKTSKGSFHTSRSLVTNSDTLTNGLSSYIISHQGDLLLRSLKVRGSSHCLPLKIR